MSEKRKKKIVIENPDWYNDLEDEYLELFRKKMFVDDSFKRIRNKILRIMSEKHIDKIKAERTDVSYIPMRTVLKIDRKKLEKEHPDILMEYSSESTLDEHIMVRINKKSAT